MLAIISSLNVVYISRMTFISISSNDTPIFLPINFILLLLGIGQFQEMNNLSVFGGQMCPHW